MEIDPKPPWLPGKSKPFEPGMVLRPGETTQVEFSLPEWVCEAIDHGHQVRILHGKTVRVSQYGYRKEVVFYLDDRKIGEFTVTWERANGSWREKIRDLAALIFRRLNRSLKTESGDLHVADKQRQKPQ